MIINMRKEKEFQEGLFNILFGFLVDDYGKIKSDEIKEIEKRGNDTIVSMKNGQEITYSARITHVSKPE